ncbi:glycoside hydrolase family 43 protein [Algoriphagus machipongonensis]|uniref:Glycosyl hydrolase, family 43 n=1 Tax=Algoriphagus machipongonensis TaxID=388413 RepID=A3HV08_9BACT|nr:glycoside hydrolase family 43 protein [Algoriphagus machipongonensis]EAZ81980.1 glycosyl hydrolase, family 43 [Algoriphagus machipongonensis]
MINPINISKIVLFVFLFAGISSLTFGQSRSFDNPVLAGDRPDPTVIKIDNYYYASATSNEWAPLFPIFKSDDLVNWELVNYVFPDGAPSWAKNNFWAPELSYDEDQGVLYAYYTARDKESNRLSVAVASASSPLGKFTDHGPLVAQEYGSIDAFEAKDENGKIYVLWKEDGNSKGQKTPIWAQEINQDRTALIGDKHELFRNDQEWEGGLVEGVAIFQKNGYFYATYSARGCCEITCDYVTGVARSKSLLGPWEKYDMNPVLQDNENWKCAGHGTVVEKNGELWMLYHAYNTEGSVYVGRQGVLEKIEWTDDNWPILANNAGYERSKASLEFNDNFKERLDPIWQWRVTQDIQYKTGEEGLKLQASKENETLGTLLVQGTKSLDYQYEATIIPDEQAAAGLAVIGGANNGFGAPVAGMGVSVRGDQLMLWETINQKTNEIATVNISSENPVKLILSMEEGYKMSTSAIVDGEIIQVGEIQDVKHLVPWGMGFRLGLVAKGSKDSYAHFKEVKIVY